MRQLPVPRKLAVSLWPERRLCLSESEKRLLEEKEERQELSIPVRTDNRSSGYKREGNHE